MRIRSLFAAVIVAGTFVGGVAYGGSDPATTTGALPPPSAPAPDGLSLVLSLRALAVGSLPLSIGPTDGTGSEVGRVKAPTGAGTDRWPTGELGKGVYISVMPACIPGVDEPIGPARRAPARRR